MIEKLPDILAVSPEYSSRQQAIYLAQNMQVSVYGVVPSYLVVRNSSIEYGSFISDQNVTNVDKVAVIGFTTAETLFGTENPIGKDIRLGNVILKVIGVMEQK
ncbi:ABC transporter permease [Patescibacteria group bacterium]|nr:ABC transporter permease [Patescibacteria group bacterium]MBU1757775.1 ABC transporter permease [Patescibacteria group bacterium]